MALCHKWDVKNDFAYVLQFFPLISDGPVSVSGKVHRSAVQTGTKYITELTALPYEWEYGGFLTGHS